MNAEHISTLINKFNDEHGGQGEQEYNRLCLLDSYHDFNGDRSGETKETIVNFLDGKYNSIIGTPKETDWSKSKCYINQDKFERNSQAYYFRKYKDLFNSTYEGITATTYTYTTFDKDVKERNILMKEDLSKKFSKEQYKAVGEAIKIWYFPDLQEGEPIYFNVDAIYHHLDKVLSPLEGIVYQTITPTNITDSATAVSFDILESKDKSRTEYVFPVQGTNISSFKQTANLLTKDKFELSIENVAFTNLNPYGFKWVCTKGAAKKETAPSKVRKHGPSVASLSEYISKGSSSSTNEIDVSPFLVGLTSEEKTSLLIDIKRTGDHEQAAAVYYMRKSGKKVIFVTGDTLSALFSYAIGNPTILCYSNNKVYPDSRLYEMYKPIDKGVTNEKELRRFRIRQLCTTIRKIHTTYEQCLDVKNTIQPLIDNIIEIIGNKDNISTIRKLGKTNDTISKEALFLRFEDIRVHLGAIKSIAEKSSVARQAIFSELEEFLKSKDIKVTSKTMIDILLDITSKSGETFDKSIEELYKGQDKVTEFKIRCDALEELPFLAQFVRDSGPKGEKTIPVRFLEIEGTNTLIVKEFLGVSFEISLYQDLVSSKSLFDATVNSARPPREPRFSQIVNNYKAKVQKYIDSFSIFSMFTAKETSAEKISSVKKEFEKLKIVTRDEEGTQLVDGFTIENLNAISAKLNEPTVLSGGGPTVTNDVGELFGIMRDMFKWTVDTVSREMDINAYAESLVVKKAETTATQVVEGTVRKTALTVGGHRTRKRRRMVGGANEYPWMYTDLGEILRDMAQYVYLNLYDYSSNEELTSYNQDDFNDVYEEIRLMFLAKVYDIESSIGDIAIQMKADEGTQRIGMIEKTNEKFTQLKDFLLDPVVSTPSTVPAAADIEKQKKVNALLMKLFRFYYKNYSLNKMKISAGNKDTSLFYSAKSRSYNENTTSLLLFQIAFAIEKGKNIPNTVGTTGGAVAAGTGADAVADPVLIPVKGPPMPGPFFSNTYKPPRLQKYTPGQVPAFGTNLEDAMNAMTGGPNYIDDTTDERVIISIEQLSRPVNINLCKKLFDDEGFILPLASLYGFEGYEIEEDDIQQYYHYICKTDPEIWTYSAKKPDACGNLYGFNYKPNKILNINYEASVKAQEEEIHTTKDDSVEIYEAPASFSPSIVGVPFATNARFPKSYDSSARCDARCKFKGGSKTFKQRRVSQSKRSRKNKNKK